MGYNAYYSMEGIVRENFKKVYRRKIYNNKRFI